MSDDLDQQDIKKFYEDTETVWPENDGWHLVNQLEIKKYLHKHDFPKNSKVLNVGSGGNDYGLSCPMYHLDIARNKIHHLKNHIIASVEEIPYCDNTFSHIICVGSVLNYCDAANAIGEITRVLKPNGKLILEFEGSFSFEYLLSTTFKKPVAIANTMYFNKAHKMWVYSEKYIFDLLKQHTFVVQDIYRFHIMSSLVYRLCYNENHASKYARWDVLLRNVPFIKKYAANIIISCTKS